MRTRTAALAVLLLFALTGCSQTEAAPSAVEAPAVVSSETDAAPAEKEVEETVAPLAVTAEPDAPSTPEEEFLNRIRYGIAGTELESATDAQLLASGQKACDQLAAGVPVKDVLVIEGETRGEEWYPYSSAFATFGGNLLCPEVYPEDAYQID